MYLLEALIFHGFWDVIINHFYMYQSFSVHKDIWDDMKTRQYYLPWLTRKGIDKESLKNFLRFARIKFPGFGRGALCP